jgi:4-aminobutyrate aminotransferase / (S)-3-amino-2-methylpropionate transaminase / 5-aminovalerate transaminase
LSQSIVLRTEVPGPRSRALDARRAASVARAKDLWMPMFVDHASGALLTDVDGNTFIDFAGGIGCLNVGHSHPRVVAAVQAAASRFLHTDFTIVPYESYVELAERLGRLVPISGETRAAFFNSGAEAVENAVKIAKAHTRRPAVIAYEGAFHGRTHMAMSLTSKVHPYKAGFGPFAPEVYRVAFPNAYRLGPDADRIALDDLDRALQTRVAPEAVAAIIIEPVQGEGGFVPASPGYMAGLREICDDHGIVLIADEVQSGYGRTGTLFAMEQLGVEPDLVTIAKSMAGGMPISGVVGRAGIVDAAGPSTIGGTFVGNPIGCAAALAVLDVIEDEGLLERSVELGGILRSRFEAVQARTPAIGDVRGLGPMIGVELVRDEAGTPAPEIANAIVEHAMRRGLILLKAGVHGNVIRTLVPLVITDAQVAEALDVFEAALEEAARSVAPLTGD